MVSIRAVYRQGQLHLLDPVNLEDGQQVHLQIIETPETPLHVLIADMLTTFEATEGDVDEAALLQELDHHLAGKRPLSEIILEDR